MPTEGDIGYGAKITFQTSQFAANITAINRDGRKREAINVTHMASPNGWMEFTPSRLKDPGGVTVQINYKPGNEPPFGAPEVIVIEGPVPAGLTTGAKITCSGFVESESAAIPLQGLMTQEVRLKFTGEPTFTAAA